ncbi:MAG: hypothetical protein IMX00_10040 [Limnochordales bacterium]|nr:hypothetical protein [Limnochordales bacterium]
MSFVSLYITIATIIYLSVSSFYLVDGLVEWRKRGQPTWALFWVLVLLIAAVRLSRLALAAFPISFLIGGATWFFGRGRQQFVGLSDPLLLGFASLSSVAISGALAGFTVLFIFFTLFGVTDRSVLGLAIPAALVLGAILAVAKKFIRKRWPERLGEGSAGLTQGGMFYMDEVIALIASLFLLPLLGGMAIAGPFLPMAVYFAWSFLQMRWLRWVAAVDESQRMEAEAYDVILRDDHLAAWLGELKLDYQQDTKRYVVSGTLPSRGMLASLETRLRGVEGADVDLSRVRIDPELKPDPWKQVALGVRSRFSRRGR